MTGIDTVTSTFYKLYDVETELCLNNGRYFAGFEREGGSLEFTHHIATGEESQLTPLGRGARVLRIKGGKHREFLTFDDTFTQGSKFCADTVTFGFRDNRLKDNFRYFVAFRHDGKAVGGKRIEELSHFGRGYLHTLGEVIFDTTTEKIGAHHTCILFLEFLIVEAGVFTNRFFASILAKNPFKIVLNVLVHLLVRHFHTIDFSLMDEELREDEILQNIATCLTSIRGTETRLCIGTLDVRKFNNIFANNGSHTVDKRTLLGLYCEREKVEGEKYESYKKCFFHLFSFYADAARRVPTSALYPLVTDLTQSIVVDFHIVFRAEFLAEILFIFVLPAAEVVTTGLKLSF